MDLLDDDLDIALVGIVGVGRILVVALAAPRRRDAHMGELVLVALALQQKLLDGLGPVARQIVVVFQPAGIVGVADDDDFDRLATVDIGKDIVVEFVLGFVGQLVAVIVEIELVVARRRGTRAQYIGEILVDLVRIGHASLVITGIVRRIGLVQPHGLAAALHTHAADMAIGRR